VREYVCVSKCKSMSSGETESVRVCVSEYGSVRSGESV
jgi:hypothetical protein